jgi:hypothetical protein
MFTLSLFNFEILTDNPPDFTATTIIERFQDEAAGAAVERCLKKLATKKAKEQLEQREPKLPSPPFISSYLGAFRPRTSTIVLNPTDVHTDG